MKKTSPAGLRRSRELGAAVLVGWFATASPVAGSGAHFVDGAWARASIGSSKVSAVYLVVTNRDDSADRLRLLRVETERAGHTMIHRSVVEDGVGKMRPVDAIEIPPRGSARLEPGGLHVMLMRVSPPLETGENVSVTLVFERAGPVVLSVPVRMSPPE